MKRTRLIVSICGLLAVVPASLRQAVAQTANPPPARRAPAASEDPVKLSAFEVSADKDNSYGALQSNSLTAFKMDLAKAPVTAQVFTQTFMDDVGATGIEDLLVAYSGTVTGSSNNNQDKMVQEPGDRSGNSSSFSIRGTPSSGIQRDGFIGPTSTVQSATGITNNFSVERVELIEGPQSLLYGSVSGGGVVNSISKRATFNQRKGSARIALDSYGTVRGLLDYNYGAKKVAVRVASTAADNKTARKNIGHEFFGLYTQVAVQLLPGTTLRLQGERASADARISGAPSLDNFLATTDPRRGNNSRYLALTGPLDNLHILDGHLDYYNIDSLASWFSTEKNTSKFAALTLESRLPAGFSLQLRSFYSEMWVERFTNGGSNASVLPARGLPNAAGNPFSVSAMRIGQTDGTNVRMNNQQGRNRGVKIALLHEDDVSLFGWRGRSQTSVGGQQYHRGPTGPNGIDTIYYRADANWKAIINPAIALDYGRVPLDFVYFPIQGGVPKKPLFKPGETKITVNGVNYVLERRIFTDSAHVAPGNPFGMIPNNPTATNPGQFSGQWSRGGETHNQSYYAANFTDWAGGRLTTLLGASVSKLFSSNIQSGGAAGVNNVETPHLVSVGWQAGINYEVRPWIRVYMASGTTGKEYQVEGSANDIFGNPLRFPESKSAWPDVGVKLNTLDGRYSAQLNFNPKSEVYNERRSAGDVGGNNFVNPAGINGRTGLNTGNRVNVDRSLSSESLTFTADPTRKWRMRVSITHLDGKILTDAIYPVVYNDQFFTRGNNVTYADGTNVLIDPAGGTNRTTPLTLTMINDPSSRFYAVPDPASGSITNANLRTALTTLDPVRGRAATGINGLPISAIQYNFTNPYPGGVYPVYKASDLNTGFNEYSLNAQNNYTFTEGVLKGFAVFGDVQTFFKNRAYYVTTPGKDRYLYRLPRSTVFNLGLTYKRKLTERYSWTTQLNVQNALNHYKVLVMPTASNGTQLSARLSTQPRLYVWTNSISF